MRPGPSARCYKCGGGPAVYTCVLCIRSVCREHHALGAGHCCVAETCAAPAGTCHCSLHIGRCDACGRNRADVGACKHGIYGGSCATCGPGPSQMTLHCAQHDHRGCPGGWSAGKAWFACFCACHHEKKDR